MNVTVLHVSLNVLYYMETAPHHVSWITGSQMDLFLAERGQQTDPWT